MSIGQGPDKTSYIAFDGDTGREVEWTIYDLQSMHPSKMPSVKYSIDMMKGLNHPNIVQFISTWFGQNRPELNLVTELVSGGNLKSYIKKMGVSNEDLLKKWAFNLLSALDCMHSLDRPIIHRNVKCENVFINTQTGIIKLGGFNLAIKMDG